jgi:hypothetical protein
MFSYTKFDILFFTCVQFLHSGLKARFTRSPDGKICPLARQQFLHSRQPEDSARRAVKVQKLHAGRMQKMHFSCVQKLHVILN